MVPSTYSIEMVPPHGQADMPQPWLECERFFTRRPKNENLNLYLLDRVSDIFYHNDTGGAFSPLAAKEDDMKFQSVAHEGDRVRSAYGAYLSKENALLASAVTLAFAFVTACVFVLG